jgi:purine-binding chemotaxis protein CheW
MERVTTQYSTEMKQVISFAVGTEEYGLELQHVKEVIRMPEITRLPDVPRYVRGLINLRGDVVPVIDLRERLGQESVTTTPSTRVIVVEVGDGAVGMVVDSVSQVTRLRADELEPPPPLFGGASKEYITAVGKLENGLIILIDIQKVFGSEEIEGLKNLVETEALTPAASP